MEEAKLKESVRKSYAQIAKSGGSCCGPAGSCGCGSLLSVEELSRTVGYGEEELRAAPPGSNLGLGCGNPTALAALREGETVLDLGSGAGFDCFLAAAKVGPTGKVIGVDMTPEMVARARENARGGGYGNVEFRLGEIEHLPVADATVDVVISNCVINLVPDKGQAFREAWRVLKPGGRLLISDLVLLRPLPESVRGSMEAYVGCVAGAALKPDYLKALADAGFDEVEVVGEDVFPVDFLAGCTTLPVDVVAEAASAVASLKVRAYKPS
ncbi:MAG: arsenite methyltransferase [Betaproteobacteria bacterium]